MRHLQILSIASFFAAFALVSCGGDDKPATTSTGTGGSDCTHFDYSKYMPGAAKMTLAANVMPIFTNSCALGLACHSNGSHPPNLGGASTSAAMVSAALIDVKSTEVASMKYVVKGDPQNSFLMRKLEDTNPACGLDCVPPTGVAMACSTQMPSGLAPLSPTDQTTIRDWIKQGAN